MIKLAADENFNGKIIRGIRRRNQDVDIVRVQDSSVFQGDDPSALAWAAQENRVLLTHDIRTMSTFALERIERSLPMPGLFQVNQTAAISQTIEDVLLLATCSNEGAWEGQIHYLPF